MRSSTNTVPDVHPCCPLFTYERSGRGGQAYVRTVSVLLSAGIIPINGNVERYRYQMYNLVARFWKHESVFWFNSSAHP